MQHVSAPQGTSTVTNTDNVANVAFIILCTSHLEIDI
jgi:hypothetical protein